MARRERSRAVVTRLHYATENLKERLVLAAPHPLESSSLDGTLGFQIKGINDRDRAGFAVSSAGDVNGDGFEDLIINTRRIRFAEIDDDAEYVVFGRSTGFDSQFSLSELDGSNGFRIVGGISYGVVIPAGDINGDGFADLLFSGESNYYTSACVVFGQRNFAPSISLNSLDGVSSFRISSGFNFDDSGVRATGMGDINGDGFCDLAPTYPKSNSAETNQDYGEVIFGNASGCN